MYIYIYVSTYIYIHVYVYIFPGAAYTIASSQRPVEKSSEGALTPYEADDAHAVVKNVARTHV